MPAAELRYADGVNIIIVGGGETGFQIAQQLHAEQNVTVIDTDAGRARDLESLDVRFLNGNGADPEVLRAADAGTADAVIACTTNDDVNVLASLAARGLGARQTMAFVTRERYVDAFRPRGAMESIGLAIDRLIWPQRTLADQIVDIVRVPRAIDSGVFAGGMIRMLEYRLEEGDPFTGDTLLKLDLPADVLVVGRIREDTFTVPGGDATLEPGDKTVFMGTAESMRTLSGHFTPQRRTLTVTVVGGGNVGFMVARQLHGTGVRLVIIELEAERAEKLAVWFPKALVLRGDGTDLELLEQERLEDSDVLVAVTNDDGRNLLASLLAKQLGIPKVITRVSRAQNRRLFERVGIEAPLTVRQAAVQEVLNWLRLDEADHLASIEDRAEVIELVYPLTAAPGTLAGTGSPPDGLIGAVLRRNRAIIPDGNTELLPGDHLFVVTVKDNAEAIEAWLDAIAGREQ